MTLIADLLAQSEGKTLEFKRDLSSPKPLLKTLVAFANSAGGRLVVGVSDDKHIIGVDDPLSEEERLCNLIADNISPRLVPNIELATVDAKTLLVVEVFPSNSRPHFLRKEGAETGVFVRLGSTNRQADRQLIDELRRGVEGISFDSLPMPQLSLDDLDMKAIQTSFAGKRTINETALQTLKLITQHQSKWVPTHGGILLYGKDRRFHFDDAWIQCGRFIGTDKADIFDHIDILDPLPQAVDSIMLFLKKHAMRGADFSEVRRKDVWSIPLNILREVVINALVHADYSHRGTPIRIAFFDDRIEVESPGFLLPGLTVEDMKRGASQIRNPVIARVFRELELIEQWGSGIPGIFREAKANHLPEPLIEELALRIRVIVGLAAPLTLTANQSRKTQPPATEANETQRLESRLDSRLESALAAKVMFKLHQQEIGKSALAQYLGHKTVSGELHKQIKRLLELGLIEMTLPDKPNSRLQKYRLTESGLELINSLANGN
ncbi:MAG: putative DNA binding domain-containing protein [Methylomicrobium sp.]|nr:putative DNA binding domain-containing protein [Methylomicrobium sp.]